MRWAETGGLPAGALAQLEAHIVAEMPREAVGLLWDSPGCPPVVIPLTNTSDDPEHSYEVDVAEIVTAFASHTGRDILTSVGDDDPALLLWHSHPSGAVGPSRRDVRDKPPTLRCMVVAVDQAADTLTATLF